MHPYSEYLQDFVYKNYNLKEGGKFKNDFRVTSIGRIMRKFWLDELPMIINLFRGELKIVGVRPLSQQYFNLYSKELQEKRIKFKPGLIPPFYADNPKTLEDIIQSELTYLEAYEKHPLRTDIKYFIKAVFNILFKKSRSN
jgi:lipopolysaccharide/colanic/teichoic acid biosynthesis glycosyltransferase